MKNTLKKAFLVLNQVISRKALTDERKNVAKTLCEATSEAVAVVAHVDRPHLYVANLGDCKAVLRIIRIKYPN